jgi:biotin carboxyl carrier protein
LAEKAFEVQASLDLGISNSSVILRRKPFYINQVSITNVKLFAEHEGEKHEIEIKTEGSNVFAQIDGRKYEFEAREVEPNTYLFNVAGKIYECYVAPKNPAGITRVRQGTKSFDFQLSDPKRLRGAANADATADGIANIVTQMPGKVVRVLVDSGAEVKSGDGIIVVEAMKMQNEMKSPKDGIVKEIRFEVGATVNAGDVLAVIE